MSNHILILNQHWKPIKIVSFKIGISLLFRTNEDCSPKALILNIKNYQTYDWQSWMNLTPEIDDLTIKTPNKILYRPKVIILTRYNETMKTKVKLTRKNIFIRDGFTCTYCGKQKTEKDLTIDHIIAKSSGGQTNWTNCTTACNPCNRKKANYSLEYMNLKLLKQPVEPSWTILLEKHIKDLNIFLKLP